MYAPILIVGQGLAGSVLALTLHKASMPCMVVDAGIESSASAVAAGIFNPVTGKRLQLTWMAQQIFDALHAFYPWAEQELTAYFFYQAPNLRPLFTEKERQVAEKLLHTEHFSNWLVVEDSVKWTPAEAIHAPYGYLRALRSGYVDVPTLLAATARWLEEKGSLLRDKIDYSALKPTNGGIEYAGRRFSRVVFAEGVGALHNPYLKGISLRPLKGEILLLNANTKYACNAVINRAGYLAPRADGTFWAGATYQHNYDDDRPTKAAQTDILERISKFCSVDFEVQTHLAGIRPSTADRRPIIGPIDGLPNGFVFNGLGTKGVSLAPLMAQQLIKGWTEV